MSGVGPWGKIHNKNCCCGDYCPCCPGWLQSYSVIVNWLSSIFVTNDCETTTFAIEVSGETFTCSSTGDATGTILVTSADTLYVRVFCPDVETGWKVQYKSTATGGVWTDAPDLVFVCPHCDDAIDGIAYGSIDFTAQMQCEISGPTTITYDVTVHGDIEMTC